MIKHKKNLIAVLLLLSCLYNETSAVSDTSTRTLVAGALIAGGAVLAGYHEWKSYTEFQKIEQTVPATFQQVLDDTTKYVENFKKSPDFEQKKTEILIKYQKERLDIARRMIDNIIKNVHTKYINSQIQAFPEETSESDSALSTTDNKHEELQQELQKKFKMLKKRESKDLEKLQEKLPKTGINSKENVSQEPVTAPSLPSSWIYDSSRIKKSLYGISGMLFGSVILNPTLTQLGESKPLYILIGIQYVLKTAQFIFHNHSSKKTNSFGRTLFSSSYLLQDHTFCSNNGTRILKDATDSVVAQYFLDHQDEKIPLRETLKIIQCRPIQLDTDKYEDLIKTIPSTNSFEELFDLFHDKSDPVRLTKKDVGDFQKKVEDFKLIQQIFDPNNPQPNRAPYDLLQKMKDYSFLKYAVPLSYASILACLIYQHAPAVAVSMQHNFFTRLQP